jgi:phage tail-like protein
MDVNGARFALLLGAEDWGRCRAPAGTKLAKLADAWDARAHGKSSSVAADWDDTRQELTLRADVSVFKAPPGDRAVTLDDRRGAALDRNGNVYWVDAARAGIAVLSSGSGNVSTFWPSPLAAAPAAHGDFSARQPAQATPAQFGGMAITEDSYLVVGNATPAGLLVFDLVAGGPPSELRWPATVTFAPFDLAARPCGGVWVLDRDNRRCWELDRRLAVVAPPEQSGATASEAPDFQPVTPPVKSAPPAAPAFPSGISLASSSPLDASDPVAIEALPDNTVLVLDRDSDGKHSRVIAYRGGARIDGDDPSCRLDFVAHDFVFMAVGSDAARPGLLLIADSKGNQAYAFEVLLENGGLRLIAEADFYPLRRFGGKALIAAADRALYDFGERWVPLVAQRRADYATEVEIRTPVFDAMEPQCVWHRLMLDACIPPGTLVRVWSCAGEEKLADTEAVVGAWQEEPALYLRGEGQELAWQRPWNDVAVDYSKGDGTWELLFQHARGRYLQLRLVLSGNRRATPRLRALRAWYPRFSYSERFLPAAYREEPVSASFIDRLLANFEGFYTELEGRIANVQALFDPRTTPPDTLDWLADWFAIAMDPAWDERRRRLFLRHAMDFFRYRGTVRGLKMALHLAFDPQIDEANLTPSADADVQLQDIRVVERYLLRRAPAVSFGDAQDSEGLRVVVADGQWSPAEGNAGLVRRYAGFLGQTATAAQEATPFVLTPPADTDAAQQWTQFVQQALGFVPDLKQSARWRDFLQRRYRRISALNTVYGTDWESFDEVPLPDTLPPDGAAQTDWYDFQTRVLAIGSTAHRFRVLLPTADINLGVDEAQRRKDLATRIVNLEKPAHTSFDVGFYWAMFRIDEARLGFDTLLDVGSRAPQLIPDAVLGQTYVGESFLGGPSRPSEPDRLLLDC